jgi:hypothetical protein
MNQYGGEAVQKKVAERRADRRSQTFRKIRRIFLLFIVLAAFAAAVVCRHEVQGVLVRLRTGSGPSAFAKAELNTKSRLASLQQEAERRSQAIEAIYK